MSDDLDLKATVQRPVATSETMTRTGKRKVQIRFRELIQLSYSWLIAVLVFAGLVIGSVAVLFVVSITNGWPSSVVIVFLCFFLLSLFILFLVLDIRRKLNIFLTVTEDEQPENPTQSDLMQEGR